MVAEGPAAANAVGRARAALLVRAGVAVSGPGDPRTAVCRRCNDCGLGCAVRMSSTAINGGIMKGLSLAAAVSMLGLALAMSPITDLQAAELRILAGGSMTGPLNELGPQFEPASGHKLVIHFVSTP